MHWIWKIGIYVNIDLNWENISTSPLEVVGRESQTQLQVGIF